METRFFAAKSLMIILLFIQASYPQEVKNNVIKFRNHILNSDTLSIAKENQILKPFSDYETGYDTVQLPFEKPDFMVNSIDGDFGSVQNYVSAAIDGNGNYAFTWIDYRNGKKEIYAQFFNKDDQRIGNNFKVNETDLIGNNAPFIACNEKGDFIIVWLRDFNSVMVQMLNPNGQKFGGNNLVNSIWGMNTSEPSVAVNNDGSFLVMWASEPGSGGYQVYAKLFDKDGNQLTSEIFVNEQENNISSISQGKHVAVDMEGNYCITWSSYSNFNSSKIFLQMIGSNGQKNGDNTLVSSYTDSSHCIFPEITSTNDGHFMILWEQYNSSSGEVKIRIYHSDNYFVTDDLLILTTPSSWNPFDLSSDKDSTFLIFLSSNNYLVKLNKNGKFLSDTVRVDYDIPENVYSYYGGLTDIVNNSFFIAPEFQKRNDANIYLQKFSIDLLPESPLIKLHDDHGSADQKKPLVKFNKQGELLILWEDKRNGYNDLYAQIYDKDFNPVGNNFQINESTSQEFNLVDKKVECLSDGTFVIAYSSGESYYYTDIFLQLVKATGEKIGSSRIVKNNSYDEYKVTLNINSKDEILVSWYNQYNCFLRKYSKSLSAISTENNFFSNNSTVSFIPIAVSADTAFNILVVWGEYNHQDYSTDNKIKAQFFNEKGEKTSDVFVIDNVYNNFYRLDCKNDGKKIAVLFKDYSKIYLKRIYDLENGSVSENTFPSYSNLSEFSIVAFENQKALIRFNTMNEVFGFYANDNKRKAELFKLHTYDYINSFYDEFNGSNSLDIYDDNLVFSYESSINGGTGYDVWSNIRKIENINFDKEIFFQPFNNDFLYPNFPNPFNPKTKIAYEILSYHRVKLSVYDILGREVKVLVDNYQEKGLYEVEFDATGLAAGIYFYKLEAFNTIVKKMVLLK